MMSRRRPAEGAARQKEAKAMNKAGSGPDETVNLLTFAMLSSLLMLKWQH